MTDPIADMLTRIRNAQAAKKSEVVLPYSKIKMWIGEILEREGFIEKIEKIEGVSLRKKEQKPQERFKQIKINLKYKDDKPRITSLKRISKPGRRIYLGKDKLPKVLGGLGITIISTSRGVMANKEARKKGIGGEVICEIY